MVVTTLHDKKLFSDPAKTFLVLAPPFAHNSAGNVVLHELCNAIIDCGYTAHIIFIDIKKPEWGYGVSHNPKFYNEGLKRIDIPPELGESWVKSVLDLGITIYPEIISGNPLKARNIVRYFLNSDGAITGSKSLYQPNDFCLAFSKHYFDKPHAYLIKPVLTPEFNGINAPLFDERKLNLTYFGKGHKYASCFRAQDSVILPSDWPKSKAELALLLKNTRYLYSWDSQSSIITDAICCGAKPVLLQFNQISREKLDDHEFGRIPYLVGLIKDGTIDIQDNKDYEILRYQFLKNFRNFENQWIKNVGDVINKIFIHFKKYS